ncbi:hypothetical protein MRB53_032490 [Persea americana]|uniref:Uncharacterized protein n=1 Tax=Persea americana TaxID=3435 RepID=A0ACC2KSI7_PERAE|nr:hypothetical protein MRB53_032490 [Persea americana]
MSYKVICPCPGKLCICTGRNSINVGTATSANKLDASKNQLKVPISIEKQIGLNLLQQHRVSRFCDHRCPLSGRHRPQDRNRREPPLPPSHRRRVRPKPPHRCRGKLPLPPLVVSASALSEKTTAGRPETGLQSLFCRDQNSKRRRRRWVV